MKFFSVAIILLGAWSYSVFGSDQHRDIYVRAVTSLMIVGGILYYLEALKYEIIKSLSKKTDDCKFDV